MTDRAREFAEEAVGAANVVSHDGYYEVDIDAATATIRRAIAEERERCAVIAEMHDHRGDIAAAIRSQDHG